MSSKFTGILMGIVQDIEGTSYIAFDIGAGKIGLPISKAVVVFDQLGLLLEQFNVFDDEPEVPEQIVSMKCH